MQVKTIENDTAGARERFSRAVSRLENAIAAHEKKQQSEKKVRNQVVKELDTYIANLEVLLNPKSKKTINK